MIIKTITLKTTFEEIKRIVDKCRELEEQSGIRTPSLNTNIVVEANGVEPFISVFFKHRTLNKIKIDLTEPIKASKFLKTRHLAAVNFDSLCKLVDGITPVLSDKRPVGITLLTQQPTPKAAGKIIIPNFTFVHQGHGDITRTSTESGKRIALKGADLAELNGGWDIARPLHNPTRYGVNVS